MTPLEIDTLASTVINRLVAHLPAEATAIAQSAANAADTVSLLALADWVEERRFAGLAARIRRMAVRTGDLLVVTLPDHISESDRAHIVSTLEHLEARLRQAGIRIETIIMPASISIQRYRLEGDGAATATCPQCGGRVQATFVAREGRIESQDICPRCLPRGEAIYSDLEPPQ